jgi:glycosyltransferase involved in cell wall biosynthesis
VESIEICHLFRGEKTTLSMKTLLVIVPDRISDILTKGEYPPRYYNPGDFFDEVHLLLTGNDQPNPALLQPTVGEARLHLHNITPPPFVQTLGWQSYLLKPWVKSGIELAQLIKPDVIRVHGNYFNGYLGVQIKKQLGIPLVVSLHTDADEGHRKANPWWPKWKSRFVFERRLVVFEIPTLRNADWVLPVYDAAGKYAVRHGAKNIRVSYNMLNWGALRKKEDYRLHTPPRIICVNRQFREKNPEEIIRAVARLDAELTLIGDGPYHEHLQSVVRECGIQDRVIFRKNVPNDDLCSMLPDYDIFAAHVGVSGIAKTIMEAILTGLPVVTNYPPDQPVSELKGDWLRLVENTPDGYYGALHQLLTDASERERLGQRAYAHAQERYNAKQMEQNFVNIYQGLLAEHG